MFRHLVVFAFAVQACWLAGCSDEKGPETKPTVPVTGTVHVDGKPTPMVRVLLFPSDNIPGGIDPNVGSPHWAMTDPDGNFKVTTYYAGDGVPVGEYAVAFYWEGNPKLEVLGNPDEPQLDPVAVKFNRKYSNPAKSAVDPVKVEEGKPVNLGTLELKSK